jgi:hypothetical protein
MDIASTATALSQSKVANGVDISVAKKALDAAKEQGAAAVALIQAATIPDPSGKTGSNVDTVG